MWSKMKDRCYNPNVKAYKWYGARGIRVCNRWLDINKFIEDMYASFKEGLTIERMDNDGNYEPSNCTWATRSAQAINKRYKKSNVDINGVHKRSENGKYRAYIMRDNKMYHLGTYNTVEEAFKIRKRAENLNVQELLKISKSRFKRKL